MIPRNRVKPNGKVDLWDLGPQVGPKPPTPPKEPDRDKLKGVELAVAEVEYEDALELHKNNLRDYGGQRRAHLAWKEQMGGALKVELFTVDARHAMEVEPGRYVLDLPKGAKPGKAQAEAEEREAAEAEALRQARASDPFSAGAPQ